MYLVKLTYFKDTGKYYTEGKYKTKEDFLFAIWDEVREMKEHPGLIGKWIEGYILIEVPDHPHNHPRLIMP